MISASARQFFVVELSFIKPTPHAASVPGVAGPRLTALLMPPDGMMVGNSFKRNEGEWQITLVALQPSPE
jgi:hypothetical protein